MKYRSFFSSMFDFCDFLILPNLPNLPIRPDLQNLTQPNLPMRLDLQKPNSTYRVQ